MITKLSRFQGSLLGVRIGDGLGMPWESLTAEQIQERTAGKGVQTFWSPQQRSDAPKWAQKLGILHPGDSTDDWQMTRSGAQSLIRNAGLDLKDLANAYIEEMRRCALGWGGTTKWGLRQIQTWFKTHGQEGRAPGEFAPDPKSSNDRFGTGNGVAMRVGPMGLLGSHAFDEHGGAHPGTLPIFMESIWKIGGLTHPDPRATIGAFAVADLIARMTARNGAPLKGRHAVHFLDTVLDDVLTMELTHGSRIAWARGREKVSARLRWVKSLLLANANAVNVRARLGTSSYTLESVPFSIATFLRHPTNFRTALREAVEAGGDTDSNAAIVGSLVGANVGLEGIPPEWRSFRPDFQEAESLGEQLWLILELLSRHG